MKKKFLAFCMAVTMVSSMAIPVNAANTGDTEYWFKITAAYQKTEAREKTNTTKVYTYYTEGPAKLAFQTWASVNDNNNSGTNATVGGTVYLRKGVRYSITNKIKEWGYSYAYLRVNSADESGLGMSAYGVWSPDSSRNYTVSN